MKKILTSIVVLVVSISVSAQSVSSVETSVTKKWSVSVGAGFGTTWRYEKNFMDATGLVLSVEPTYKAAPWLNLGARAEYVFIKSYLTSQAAATRVSAKAFPSLAITGDIMPWKGKVAPFAGVGGGLYFLGSATSTADNRGTSTDLETRFGVSPRVGVAISNISILAELHLIDEKTLFNRDYATLKVRYTFK